MPDKLILTNKYEVLLDGIVRTIPHTGLQCAILAMVFGGDPKLYATYIGTYLVGTEIFSHSSKLITGKVLKGVVPDWVSRRPGNIGSTGATGSLHRVVKGSRSAVPTSCSVYPTCGKASKTFGFWSGHCASVAFNAVFWSLYLWRERKDMSRNRKIGASVFLSALALLVIGHRWMTSCHSPLQIVVGSLVGALSGWGGYEFYRRVVLGGDDDDDDDDKDKASDGDGDDGDSTDVNEDI